MKFSPRLTTLALAIAASTSAAAQIEEVVVTAQKRAQNLTDVPLSISAVTEETLEKQSAKRLSDMSNTLPNVNMTDSGDRITIRGVGASSRNIGFDTRVGVYIDGVYVGQSPALNQELAELEQVEVLRGPQGTLFGKNTVAGAINLITKKPDLNEVYGNVTFGIGNMGLQEAKFVANAPVSDTFAINIAGSTVERDGYTKNVYGSQDPIYPYPPLLTDPSAEIYDDESKGGEMYGDRNVQTARIQMLWEPNDRLSARFAYDTLTSDETPGGREPLSDTLGNFLDPYSPGDYTVNVNTTQFVKRDLDGYALTIDYDLPNDFAFKSITAHRITDSHMQNDLDYGPRDWIWFEYEDLYEQTTQEFQIISPEYDNFNFVAGLYYYQQDAWSRRDVNIGEDIRELDMFFAEVPPQFALQPNTTVYNEGVVDTESYALYFNGSYQFAEKHQLTFGFRWETEEKTVDWALDGRAAIFLVGTASDAACAEMPQVFMCNVRDDRRDTNFAPALAYNYFINDEHTLYARVARGFKSGGYNLDFNSQSALIAGLEFDQESVTSYEIGAKGTLAQSFAYSAAVFRADYDDYQVSQIIEIRDENGLPIGTTFSIGNAAKVETYGLEFEGTYYFTDELSLSLNYGWLEASFDSFPGGGPNGEDLAGNELPRAPEHTYALAFDYNTSFGAYDVYAHVDYTYTDGFYTTENNEDHTYLYTSLVDFTPVEIPYGTIGDYALLNANIGVNFGEGRYNVSLWGKNLTDEVYQLSTGKDFMGTVVNSMNLPRTYGVSFKLSY